DLPAGVYPPHAGLPAAEALWRGRLALPSHAGLYLGGRRLLDRAGAPQLPARDHPAPPAARVTPSAVTRGDQWLSTRDVSGCGSLAPTCSYSDESKVRVMRR